METEKKIFNIIIFGGKNVGKSNIITRYVENKLPGFMQSVFNYYTNSKEIEHEGEKITLSFEKISKLEELTEEKIKAAEAFLLVYDALEPESCEVIFEGRKKIIEFMDSKYIKHFPFVVVGNKFDCEEQEFDNFKLKVFLKNYNYYHIKVSAKENINIDKLFNNLISQTKIFKKMKDEGYFEKVDYDRNDENCCIIF